MNHSLKMTIVKSYFFNFIICAFFKVPGRFRGVPGVSGWFRAVPGRFRHLHTPLFEHLLAIFASTFLGFYERNRERPIINAAELNNFHEVSQEDVKQIAYKPLSKSCCLDPLPASLFKDCFPVLLPTITRMVNLSLTTGFMPDALKIASLSPTLKKPTADFKQFTNFRPMSINLKSISKLVDSLLQFN